MRHALKSFSSSHSSARVVDGKLILSLPHALTPVVWQMDMTQAKASALEVRENGGKNTFSLILKTPRGEDTEIAPFETRAQAVEALMSVARALENAQGQIRPFPETTGLGGGEAAYRPAKSRSLGKWVAGILSVLLLLILVNIWGSLLPRDPEGVSGRPIDPVSLDSAPAAKSSGVPVSADDFLNGQK